MSFGLYMLGIVILLGGLIYGAVLAGAPTAWIVVGAAIVVGAGVMTGVRYTRQRDPAE